jgi:uncharacterized protein with HEPN domain
VSRSDEDRLLDIVAAIEAIGRHVERGSLDDGLIFDAVRARLMEIGEAVKDVDSKLLAQQPAIPWRRIATMRDQLAHRYFDTSHAIVAGTVTNDLVELRVVVEALTGRDSPSRACVSPRPPACGPCTGETETSGSISTTG